MTLFLAAEHPSETPERLLRHAQRLGVTKTLLLRPDELRVTSNRRRPLDEKRLSLTSLLLPLTAGRTFLSAVMRSDDFAPS